MRSTSLEAFYEIEFSGKAGTQKALILEYLKKVKSATRRQIAKELNMETSTVSARVNSLRDDYLLVNDSKTVTCPVSKKTVHLVELLHYSQFEKCNE